MRNRVDLGRALVLAAILIPLQLACEPPPVETEQLHFRGLGMELVTNVRSGPGVLAANEVPEPLPPVPEGTPASSVIYQNVPVVGHVEIAAFGRLMAGITSWVSPEAGCTYCHEGSNFANEGVYTKDVARRMLQMTVEINTRWKDHVGETGVTCYTCHRGMPVPAYYWHASGDDHTARGPAGGKAGQNAPAPDIGLTSLPSDPFSTYLMGEDPVRIQSTTALPTGNRSSIKQAEWTYGFMMHLSSGLGVNCTFCHNSRSFGPWEASTPERVRAWHGIQMVRSLNNDYLTPLSEILPADRVGPHGDAFKINCATCHQGVSKPLLGQSMLKDYPSLASAAPGEPWNLPSASDSPPASDDESGSESETMPDSQSDPESEPQVSARLQLD